ncbi:MAG: hypothetical protein H6556_03365 [Lewinellaceae bacterium]|nr:hypothetical protein [Lewinellaceae bacterium]
MKKNAKFTFEKFENNKLSNYHVIQGGKIYSTTVQGSNNGGVGCSDTIDTETDNGWEMNGDAVDYNKC